MSRNIYSIALAGLLAAFALPAAASQASPDASAEATELRAKDPALFALFQEADASAEDYNFAVLGSTLIKIGDMLLAKDQPDKARLLYQKVLDDKWSFDSSPVYDALHPVARARIGRLASADGRPVDAIAIYTAVLAATWEIRDEKDDEDAQDYRSEILGDLADALVVVGRHAEALRAVDQALVALDNDSFLLRPLRDRLLQIRASALEGLGNWAQAEGLRSQLLARTPVHLQPGGPAKQKSPKFADAEVQLGRNLARQGKAAQAAVLLQDALATYQPIYPTTHPSVLTGQLELSQLWLEQLGKPANALTELRKAGKAVLAAGQQNTGETQGAAKLARFRSLFRVQVAAAWAAGQPTVKPPTDPPETRLAGASSSTARHGSPLMGVAFSLDGKQVISAAEEGSIIVWNASTGRPLATLSADETGAVYHLQIDGGGVLFETVFNSVRSWSPGGPAPEEIKHPISFGPIAANQRWIVGAGRDTSKSPIVNLLWIYDRQSRTARTQVLKTDDAAAIAISPDGGRIAVVEYDYPAALNDPDMIEQLCLYSLPSGRELVCEGFNGGGRYLSFTPDGRGIFNAGLQQPKLFDADTAKTVKTFDVGRGDAGVLSPDGGRMALTLDDGSVQVFDVETSQQITRLDGHAAEVTAVAFSPDGQRIVTGSEDQTVRIWNTETGEPLLTLGGEVQFARHTAEISHAAFSPDGTKVASAGLDGVRVWDAATGVQLTVGRLGTSVEWSADGTRLLTTNGVTDAASGKVLHSLEYNSGVIYPVYLGDGSIVTAKGIFNAKGRKLRDLELNWNSRIIAAPAGTLFAVFDSGKTRVIDGRTGATLLSLNISYPTVQFTGDGQRMLFGHGYIQTPFLGLFDARTSAGLASFDAKYSIWSEAVVDPAGRRAAAMSVTNVYLWPDSKSQRLQIVMPAEVSKLAFSPDGAVLAVGLEDGSAQLRDAISGALRATLRDMPGALTDISFSPDGSRILTVSTSRIMTVWDARSGAIIVRLGQ